MRKYLGLCIWLFALPLLAQQQNTSDNAALEQKIRELEDRVIALEGQVRLLKSQGAPAAPAPSSTQPSPTAGATATTVPTSTETQAQAAPPTPPQEPVHLGGAGAAAAKALNPDISMIGDFIATTGQNHQFSAPTLEMHESE